MNDTSAAATPASPVDISGYTGNVNFRWMENSVTPEESGIYKVAYLINGQFVRASIVFNGNNWEHESDILAPLMTFWLLVAEIPLPTRQAREVPSFPHSSSDDTSAPASTTPATLREMVNSYRQSDDYEEDYLNDGETLAILSHLASNGHEDLLSLISLADTNNRHPVNTVEAMADAKVWITKVVSDLEERELISIMNVQNQDVGLVGVTFNGMELLEHGFDEVSTEVA